MTRNLFCGVGGGGEGHLSREYSGEYSRGSAQGRGGGIDQGVIRGGQLSGGQLSGWGWLGGIDLEPVHDMSVGVVLYASLHNMTQ